MDFLRRCYTTDMSFARDGSCVRPIRWVWADEDAPLLPYPTPFRSLATHHLYDGPADVLGEVLGAARPWYNGTALVPTAPGPAPCGTREEWHDGFAADPGSPPPNVFGGPECCPLPAGGFVHHGCRACPHGAMSVYTLAVTGGTGAYAGYNGVFYLTYRGGCLWATNSLLNPGPPPSNYIWALRVGGLFPTNAAAVELLDVVILPVVEYVGPLAYDCLEPATLPFAGPVPPGAAPSVRLYPGIVVPEGALCPAIGLGTAYAYLVTVPAYSHAGALYAWLEPGSYVLTQTDLCAWEGRASLNLIIGRRDVPVSGDVSLRAQPDGSVRVQFHAVVSLGIPLVLTYDSPPGYDGTVPVGCVLSPGFGFPFFRGPPAATVEPVALP